MMQKLKLWDRVKSLVFTNDATTSTLASPSADLIESLMGFPTAAGKAVTRLTAIRVATFLSGVKMMSSDIAKFPLVLRSTTNVGGRIRTIPAVDEPLYPLLRYCPNQWHTSYQMRFFLASQLIMAGNCFCQIIRNQKGDVLALNPLDAWRMAQKWDFSVPGKPVLYWMFSTDNGLRRFEQSDIWHTSNSNFEGNGVEGSAVIALAKESLALLMAGEETSGRSLANGLGMGGFITFPVDSPLTEPQAQNVVDRLKKDFSGSQNAGKFTILPGGGQWQNMTFNARDSQLLESRKFNAQEVARTLGGAPLIVKLGLNESNSTYASTSAFIEDYFNTALLPHCTALEQSITRDLIAPKDRTRLYAKHNADVILAGSKRERAETYEIQLRSGQISGNESRVNEDRDTVDGYDFYQLPANSAVYVPATQEIFIPGQQTPAPDETETAPPVEEAPPPTNPQQQETVPSPQPKKKGKGATARLETLANSLVERVMRKEQKSGSVDAKFISEVLNISLQQAEEFQAQRKSGQFIDEEERLMLVSLTMGEIYDEQT
jgi:HK97 family phage portal protein